MNDSLTRMGDLGKLLSDISNADKAMKSIQMNNDKLIRVTEETEKRAGEVESINLVHESLPEELKPLLEELKPLLEELQLEMRMVQESGINLEAIIKPFKKVTTEFDTFVREIFESKEIPTQEFYRRLVYTHEMAGNLLLAFENFMGHLNKSQELATQLTYMLKEKADEMERQAKEMMQRQAETERQAEMKAKQKRNWGIGMIFGGIGLAALSFFTGGTALLAAGGIAGISGIGIASDAGTTQTDTGAAANAEAMRKMARRIMADSNTLSSIAKSLRRSSKMAAEPIQLNDEAINALNQALTFWQKQLEKEKAQERKIAELEAKLRSHGID